MPDAARRAGTAGKEPRVRIGDLPPDVRIRFWKTRVAMIAVIGVTFTVVANWQVGLTLAILAGIIDAIYRSRTAGTHVNDGNHQVARKRTHRQLARMRLAGYFTLDARPIPDSQGSIDHLVIGPAGVYAIISEKWVPNLPLRTADGKKLYHGPESKKDQLEHAAWKAQQASDILSATTGLDIVVRPALAIYGTKVGGVATIGNVDVFTGTMLRNYLRSRGRPQLTREQVRTIYDAAVAVLPDNQPQTDASPTPVGQDASN